MRRRASRVLIAQLLVLFCEVLFCATQAAWARGPRFEISFLASVHEQPITGRVFVILAKKNNKEPRLQIGAWYQRTPFFGLDVSEIKPGQRILLQSTASGFPLAGLKDLPEGDYFVQALMSVYTRVQRADGKTLWVHLDQWEGQDFTRSPGNLYSEVQRVHLDSSSSQTFKLSLSKVIPPIELPADTSWVKHIRIQSQMLTHFWGTPIYLGATVLLPKDYEQHPDVRYPVIYIQGHFSLRAPFSFPDKEGDDGGLPADASLAHAWRSDNFPRMIAVTLQHPTPFFDDSYAVNSANNGPYGDAIMQELIPYLEDHFRILRQPYARLLTGGSTGGWESLALEVFHPDFFGGAWTFYPDPIDFHRYGMVDIYEDESAFEVPGFAPPAPERPLMRTPEGQVTLTMRQMSQFEAALGSHGRSAQQLEAWEAVYGPIDEDGYPKPVWNKETGEIDHAVATYMRDHGYDLRAYLEKHWSEIGNQLDGKIHIYCGDMDDYYLNLAVYRMEDFLTNISPPAHATFAYGRPMKGHGWQPMTNADLVRMMADHVTKHLPAAEKTVAQQY
ncbi:MAG TPA: alpha/beta hydrolase-fold protein [Terriglobales bacterium]|nr:alpha/beta hydrolase-fold protein [Terriglobales bacterium]